MDLSDEYLGTYEGFDLRSTWIITHDGVIAHKRVIAQRGRISICAESEAAAREEVDRLTPDGPEIARVDDLLDGRPPEVEADVTTLN
jgi:hypothetical protein